MTLKKINIMSLTCFVKLLRLRKNEAALEVCYDFQDRKMVLAWLFAVGYSVAFILLSAAITIVSGTVCVCMWGRVVHVSECIEC